MNTQKIPYIDLSVAFIVICFILTQPIVSAEQADSALIIELNKKGWDAKMNAPNEAIEFASRAIIESRKRPYYPQQEMEGFITIGVVYYIQGIVDSATYYYNKALKVAEDNDLKKGEAAVYNNLGSLYNRIGLYELALRNYLRSIEIKEELGESGCSISNSSVNIGNLYTNLKEYDKALSIYLKAKKSIEENKCKNLNECLIGIGVVYYKRNQPDSALNVLFSISENISVYQEAIINNNIGLCYMKKESYQLGLEFLSKAGQLNKDSINLPIQYSNNLQNMAKINAVLGSYNLAKTQLEEVMTIIEDNNSYHQKVSIFEDYSDLYELQDNWHEAYKYLSKAYVLQDSLRNLELDEMQSNYFAALGISEREQEIAEEKALRLKDQQEKLLAQKRTELSLWIIGFVIILLVISVVFLMQLQKSRRSIQIQNRLLDEKNKLIQEYQDKYVKSLDSQLSVTNKGGKREQIDLKEIVYLQRAEGDKVGKNSLKIHTSLGTEYVKKISIKALMEELGGTSFVRVNLKTIINIHFLESFDINTDLIRIQEKVWNKSNDRMESIIKELQLPKRGKIREDFIQKYDEFRNTEDQISDH